MSHSAVSTLAEAPQGRDKPLSGWEKVSPGWERGAPSLGKGRVEAFSDGVFAIAVTLLALEIHIPRATESTAADLPAALRALGPEVMSYALSFAILGVYWVAHHVMMHGLRHVNRPMLWLNLVFLLFITLIPLSADLLGQFRTHPLAVSLYGANLVLASLSLLLWWHYATRDTARLEGHVTPAYVRTALGRTSVAVGIYLAAAVVAWFNPLVSLVLYWFGPLFYIVMPSRIDTHLAQRLPSEGGEL